MIKDLRIVATLESREGSALEMVSHLELHRHPYENGLIFELDRLWRVVRARAEMHGWIGTLHLFDAERARSVSLRTTPFEPGELPECEQAATLIEAFRKLTRG